jgi:hypothetical protein
MEYLRNFLREILIYFGIEDNEESNQIITEVLEHGSSYKLMKLPIDNKSFLCKLFGSTKTFTKRKQFGIVDIEILRTEIRRQLAILLISKPEYFG